MTVQQCSLITIILLRISTMQLLSTAFIPSFGSTLMAAAAAAASATALRSACSLLRTLQIAGTFTKNTTYEIACVRIRVCGRVPRQACRRAGKYYLVCRTKDAHT